MAEPPPYNAVVGDNPPPTGPTAPPSYPPQQQQPAPMPPYPQNPQPVSELFHTVRGHSDKTSEVVYPTHAYVACYSSSTVVSRVSTSGSFSPGCVS